MATENTLKIRSSGGKSKMKINVSPCKYPHGTYKSKPKKQRMKP